LRKAQCKLEPSDYNTAERFYCHSIQRDEMTRKEKSKPVKRAH